MLAVILLLGSIQPATDPAATPGTPEHRAAAAAICRRLVAMPPSTDPAVVHSLASCLFEGHGGTRDLARARALYRQASDAGLPQAMCALGNMMIEGQGGPRDAAAGAALCRRAAEAGDAHAQADLGSHLLSGTVLARDPVAARRWLDAAAQQGHANAALLLGQVFWNGDGVAKDNAQAARWWRVAYAGGRREAAFMLGHEAFVRVTRGVARPQDADRAAMDEAVRWYRLAAQADPVAATRAEARARAEQLEAFRRQLRAARR